MPEKEKTISQMMREKGYSLVGYARSRKLINIALRDVISGINNSRLRPIQMMQVFLFR